MEPNTRPPWLQGYERARGLSAAERGAVYGMGVALPGSQSAAAASALVAMKFDSEITAQLMEQCPDIGPEGFAALKTLFYTLFEDELENASNSGGGGGGGGGGSMMEGGKKLRKQHGGAELTQIQVGHCRNFIIGNLTLSEEDLTAYIEAVKAIMTAKIVLYGVAVREIKGSIEDAYQTGATYEEALYMAIEETRPPPGGFVPQTPPYGPEMMAAAPGEGGGGGAMPVLHLPPSVVQGVPQVQALAPVVKKGVWGKIKDIIGALCGGSAGKAENALGKKLNNVKKGIDETPLMDLAKGFLGVAGGAGAGYAIFTGSLPPGMKLLSKTIALLIEHTPSFKVMLMNSASASLEVMGLGAQAGYLGAKLAFFYACVRGFLYLTSRMKGLASSVLLSDERKLLAKLQAENKSKELLVAILGREPSAEELANFTGAISTTQGVLEQSASMVRGAARNAVPVLAAAGSSLGGVASAAGSSLARGASAAGSSLRSFIPLGAKAPVAAVPIKPSTQALRSAPQLPHEGPANYIIMNTNKRKNRKTRKQKKNRQDRKDRKSRKHRKSRK